MQKNFVLKTSQFKKKQRKIFLLRTLIGIFLVALIIGSLSFIAHLSNLAIDNVVVYGNAVISSDDITKIANDNMQGNFLWIFPKSNFLIYPKYGTKNDLLDKFKRLESVSVEIKDTNTLAINVSEIKSSALWCGKDGNVEITGDKTDCYLLDDMGYIFDSAPQFSGNAYLRFYGNIVGDPIGQNYLDLKLFKKMNGVADSLKKINLPVIAFFAQENGDYQFYLDGSVNNKSGVVGKVIFDAKQDYGKALVDLESVLNDSKTGLMGKNGMYNFSYVDLRYGDKVFYK